MPHVSFRTSLLLTVLLIAAALGAAAASGWIMLQDFARASRDAGADALGMSSAMQRLDERSLDMVRSARQFAVLKDDALRLRHDEARAQADEALSDLQGALSDTAVPSRWHAAAGALAAAFAVNADDVSAAESELLRLNDVIAAAVRHYLEIRNGELTAALESSRDVLRLQVAAAVVLALLLAMAAGWWILRPLREVERAIARMGEGRLDGPVQIGGPADLQQLGERLEWLRQRLADLEAHRNRVLSHVSHELKTPLASLREGVALLRDGVTGRLTPEQSEVTAILDANARALQERIEQLIGYNATQFDARHLDLRPTALRALVREVAADLKLQAQAKDVRLEVSGYAPPVRGDAAKLRIALTNLLNNGISFSPHGGTVKLLLSSEDGVTRIDCTDEGPGVAPEESERIFEPFFRGSRRAPRPDKGNGLGLAIVREFVAAHGGRAMVVPSERGAHFRIELPHAS
ncbi:HAMP domain-containing sensor histidine kinase [Methyloversatilis thermotolerans]|uniref:HAMP domain-containing sensor histidine kinase n=1 Tax=Methyloversatilis thermotolerans TaxID=1346290 RepID=UPI00037192E6|nr:HAMP domain-containing sensor histidine kinase [Methyloversatilis thermotolerans]